MIAKEPSLMDGPDPVTCVPQPRARRRARVPCPSCHRTLKVPEEYGDKVIACKYCEHVFHPKLTMHCPQCRETLSARLKYFGRRVQCKMCDHSFRAPSLAEVAAAASDHEATTVLQAARLQLGRLEDQADRLRAELGAVSADRVAAVVELRRATEEATVLRARVDGLRKQLEQARDKLAEAARLREELDAAWAKKMNASTAEAARLREQLAAARPDSPAAPAKIGADDPLPAPITPPVTEQARVTAPAAPAGGGLDVGVKRAALSGAVWTVLGYGGVQCLRFVSNLILTRLLAPRLFGLMALVNLFVLGLHMFSDLGLLQAVIHSKRGEDTDFLNTAWTLQVLRGLTLWVCSMLIAWPASWFYGEPALCWLIPLAGLTAAINGFNSTAVFRLSRQLARGRVVLLEIGTYIVSTGFIITSVWLLGRGAAEGDPTLRTKQLLALVAGSILASLFEMTMSYRLAPGFRHRFRWDRTATPELLHFGGWIFVSTGCMFLASQADRLVVGKMSVELLGVYHVAATLANMPMVLIMSMSSQLISPLYSRLVNSGADLRTTFGGIHRTAAAFGGLLATGMVCAGPTAIRCLYDTRYAEAGQYLQLLTVAVWFTMLQSTSERVLMARGETRKMAVAQVAKLVLLPVLLLVGFRLGGLGGMILGFASAEAGRYALITWYLRREGFSVLLCDVVFSALVVAFAGIVLAVGPLLWGSWPKFARLGLETVAVLGLWSVVFLLGRSRWWGLSRQGSPAALPAPAS
jgi:O-antigen/teichoic acid export membrane protein